MSRKRPKYSLGLANSQEIRDTLDALSDNDFDDELEHQPSQNSDVEEVAANESENLQEDPDYMANLPPTSQNADFEEDVMNGLQEDPDYMPYVEAPYVESSDTDQSVEEITDIGGILSSINKKCKGAGRKRDNVWEEFSTTKLDNKIDTNKCKHSQQSVSAQAGRMWQHLEKCTKYSSSSKNLQNNSPQNQTSSQSTQALKQTKLTKFLPQMPAVFAFETSFAIVGFYSWTGFVGSNQKSFIKSREGFP